MISSLMKPYLKKKFSCFRSFDSLSHLSDESTAGKLAPHLHCTQSGCYLYNGPFFLLWITWQTMCLLSSRVKWRSPSRNNDQIYHPPPTTKHLWDLLLSRCGGSYCKPMVISESWNVEQPEAQIRKRKRDEAQSVAVEFQRDYGLVFWHHI